MNVALTHGSGHTAGACTTRKAGLCRNGHHGPAAPPPAGRGGKRKGAACIQPHALPPALRLPGHPGPAILLRLPGQGCGRNSCRKRRNTSSSGPYRPSGAIPSVCKNSGMEGPHERAAAVGGTLARVVSGAGCRLWSGTREAAETFHSCISGLARLQKKKAASFPLRLWPFNC